MMQQETIQAPAPELSGSHAGGQQAQPTEDTLTTDNRPLDDIVMAGNKARGARPWFMQSRETERVLNITMAVAGELAVLRERIDTIERLLEAKGLLSRQDIEAYEPDDAAAEERQGWHARYTARILRIVQQELEALADPEGNKPMHQIADDINDM